MDHSYYMNEFIQNEIDEIDEIENQISMQYYSEEDFRKRFRLNKSSVVYLHFLI